jgi:DNA-binding Xre family transcriptional regulator
MTRLGEFLAKNKVNRASLSRQTGIAEARLTRLSNNPSAKVTGAELRVIAVALSVAPRELLEVVCVDLALRKDVADGEKKPATKKRKEPTAIPTLLTSIHKRL